MRDQISDPQSYGIYIVDRLHQGKCDLSVGVESSWLYIINVDFYP